MPKLNDTQTILLSTASRRESGSLYPLPDTLTAGVRVTKALTSLLDRALAEERETEDVVAAHRTDGDIRYGLFITAAGLAAIGVDDGVGEALPAEAVPTPERRSKTADVITLLGRDQGATMAELIAVTDWLPHTTRAALTGLRKKGHTIERGKRGDATCYRITASA